MAVLFRQSVLSGIRDGSITLAFRSWKRPTVRAGGTIMTAVGQLAIGSVTPIDPSAISAADARRAGFADRATLLHELDQRDGQVYRIELGPLRPDPRVALRSGQPDADETAAIRARLDRLDAHAPAPWTRRVLSLIDRHPGVRAADLATQLGMERDPFKINVRKLKNLGLTISLEVGYRVSPRGHAVLASIKARR